MTLLVLIILLILLSMRQYYRFNKEICSPSLLYTVPFIFACIVALFYKNEWFFDMQWNTLLVIFCGCLVFYFGCIAGQKVKIVFKRGVSDFQSIKDKEIEYWKYYLFIIVELGCYLWKIRCILKYGRAHGSGGLSEAINYYNNALKFTTEALINWPTILSLGLRVCNAAGYVWACILAQKLVQNRHQRKHLVLTIINFAVCVIGGMSSGGRGGAVRLIIAFICAYLILYSRSKEWKIAIPFKIIIRVVILVAISGYGFIAVMDLLGRQEIHMIAKYLANYIGAQIYNLDYFLNHSYRTSEIFGQETFQPIIMYFAGKLGISKWSRYNLDLPSILINSATMGRISLGNVCTTFYSYIHDFGYVGVLILPFISGFISQITYKYARNSNVNRTQNMGLYIYSIFSYALVFSFFSNKFYELIIAPDMIRLIIFGYLIHLFLYKTRLKR